MNSYRPYQRTEPTTAWTRIELLLAMYDGALERLDRAEAALLSGEQNVAVSALARTQLLLSELAAGVRLEENETIGPNMLRLYEFAANEIRTPGVSGIENARKILKTLREGFESIRVDAVQMERSGQFTTADHLRMVHASA